ncbi:PREDICTED: 39S ribosomal protein L10, mitochondrial-like isoform X1 [Branchiostoma belcheri]|uniref:Large ribosomal subunit protein uL10m n=1 Tax=Branchiostoma belcheri TaxID=7741 RepID=A0A6P5AU19_BRABE|nr:PREDICTED: 39S ribosomal protein L10, mitochondrial-like isoform X1 [Branchiostoma belcheri]
MACMLTRITSTASAVRVVCPSLDYRWTQVRYRKTINTRSKKHISIVKAKLLAVTKWKAPRDSRTTLAEKCGLNLERMQQTILQENPLRDLMAQEAQTVLETSGMVAVLHSSDMTGPDRRVFCAKLKESDITVRFWSNTVAGLAVQNTPYSTLTTLMVGKNLYAHSLKPQVTQLLKVLKVTPQVNLIGGLVDGLLMSKSDMEHYAQLPSMEQCRGEVVSILSAEAGQTSQLLLSPLQQLSSHLQQISSTEDIHHTQ